MWPIDIENEKYTKFVKKYESINESDVESEYLSTLYTIQILVARKYKNYRASVLFIKYQVIIYFIAIVLFTLFYSGEKMP